jgi:16S rRNA (cytosine1402-N4)-methyltransferase
MHQNQTQKSYEHHVPVLLQQVLTGLAPQADERYLDLTAGYGGHADAVIAKTANQAAATLVDRDANAINVLANHFVGGVRLMHQDFLRASRQLLEEGQQFDMILADLGVSSPHLNEAGRGFSLTLEAPLDMRMDPSQPLSAKEVVNEWSEAELTRILREYGEEPKAGQIARLIIGNRPIVTTTELAAVVSKAWPGHSRVHPATRTFQAIRIAVNDELTMLEQSLPLWVQLLAPGGRLAIISFHSLEDRIVKRFLSERAGERYDAELQLTTRRPITADPTELVFNPRARSAKLRVAVKINNKTKGADQYADSG